jgi:hypothetical protein
MNKTSTVHFTNNNLALKSKEGLSDIDSIFDFKEEYNDVYNVLNQLSYDVPQEVVNCILDKASKFHV